MAVPTAVAWLLLVFFRALFSEYADHPAACVHHRMVEVAPQGCRQQGKLFVAPSFWLEEGKLSFLALLGVLFGAEGAHAALVDLAAGALFQAARERRCQCGNQNVFMHDSISFFSS
jgi:hypothetical protein